MTMGQGGARPEAARDSDGGSTPALSVVIVRFAGGRAVERTLHALELDIAADAAVEVLVAHRRDDGPTDEQRQRWPRVRWIDGGANAAPARLRSVAVHSARGALVACTEDHCIPTAGWCAHVALAHERRAAVIGGAIDKAEPASPMSWAAYLLDYLRYMPPLPAGPAQYASDCNVSYRRVELDRVRDAWREEFHETAVHAALGGVGVPLVLDPAIVVLQDREVQPAVWRAERREHGRIFAETRAAGLSRLARWRLAMMAPLLPAVILWRIHARLRERGAMHRVPRAAWPPLRRAAVAWARGELDGYLGAGR